MMDRFFPTLAGSFHSVGLYRRIAVGWQGTGLRYLALLSVLEVTIALFVVYGNGALLRSRLLDERESAPRQLYEYVIARLPDLTFDRGRLSVTAEQPVVITRPDSGEPMIVIDTRRRGASVEQPAPYVRLRLESDGFLLGVPGGGDNKFEYDGIANGTYSGDEMGRQFLDALRKVDPWSAPMLARVVGAMPIYATLFTGLNLTGNLLVAALMALGGLALCSAMRLNVPFSVLFRMACVAMTPASLIALAMFVLLLPTYQIYMMSFWLASFVNMGFLYFGLRAIATPWREGPPPRTGP